MTASSGLCRPALRNELIGLCGSRELVVKSFVNIIEANFTTLGKDTEMSNFVFVLDKNKKPLTPCKPSLARRLLGLNRAAVYRLHPFTIILKKEVTNDVEPLAIKIDPGSKVTGLAIVDGQNQVIWGAELTHRGQGIKSNLESRRNSRRGRRSRNTRYRQARFLNRTKPKDWLAPSLVHRVQTTITWVRKLMCLSPIVNASQELVRFDLQQLENPEISGIEYQQGELAGYELREYLLEKWNRTCAYCNAKDVPLQVEHIQPKAFGGTNRVSNLCIACDKCNQRKGAKTVEVFLANKPAVLARILAQAKRPLKDASAVNSTRWRLFNELKDLGLNVATGSGGQTKFNRTRLGLPKTHWIDAACVGVVNTLTVLVTKPLLIKCVGQGGRQKAVLDSFGYPKQHRQLKPINGWRNGDAALFNGLLYTICPRVTGYFTLNGQGKPITKNVRHLTKKFSADSYRYSFAT